MHQINKIRELVQWIRDIAKDHEEDDVPKDGDTLSQYARLVGVGISRVRLMDHYAAEIGERLDALEQELEEPQSEAEPVKSVLQMIAETPGINPAFRAAIATEDLFSREQIERTKPW